mmetsp:Transcript_2103/g.2827  ORF Transcript_2103/g.2827 Transcript_2103/m.2827 type:complete len:186 (-) Transcript_2103:279-836(-)
MRLRECDRNEYQTWVQKIVAASANNDYDNGNSLALPQGIAVPDAFEGTKFLRDHLVEFLSAKSGNFKQEAVSVVIPSGTGTTAYSLHAQLSHVAVKPATPALHVVAANCVGSQEYLQAQMQTLCDSAHRPETISAGVNIGLPLFFGSNGGKDEPRFGQLCESHLATYHELLETTYCSHNGTGNSV